MFTLVIGVLHRCKKAVLASSISPQPSPCKVTGILNKNVCPRSSRLLLGFYFYVKCSKAQQQFNVFFTVITHLPSNYNLFVLSKLPISQIT